MMKKIIFFLLFLSAGLNQSYSQTYINYIVTAKEAKFHNSLKASESYYKKAFKLNSSYAKDLYRGASVAALNGNRTYAFYLLNCSIKKGYLKNDELEQDSDFMQLHSDPRWATTINYIKQTKLIKEKKYNLSLMDTLLKIYHDDQDIRFKYISENQKPTPNLDSIKKIMKFKDSVNIHKIENIINSFGWVSFNTVGEQASECLFLVIQHADLNIQQKYLPKLRQAVKTGNANPSQLAYLEDRIYLREGKRQIYGTQIGQDPSVNKPYVLQLQDPKHVNERRSAIGMNLIEEYLKNFGLTWNLNEYLRELPAIEKVNEYKGG